MDGEIVWVRVEPLKHNSPLIIGAFYRTPSEREVNQLNQLEKSLDQIYEITRNNESSSIILGGDFNVGDINWDSLTVSKSSNNKAHCTKTLEIMAHFHLEQMQRQPTRLDNTLDFWLTNKPSLVRQCNSIPGISDHDIVLTDSDFKAKINKKAPHKIHLWDKADWANLRSKTSIFSNKFLDTFNSRTVEQNYQEFSNHIKNVIIEHVPSKMTSSRSNPPWFTNSLKRRPMCKKNRDYRLTTRQRQRTTMATGKFTNPSKGIPLKQSERQLRWNYINNKLQIALEQGDSGPFWRCIRSQKQDM